MKRKQAINWRRYRRRAIEWGESLAMRYSNGKLPIPLAPIVKERAIQIIFQPLLIDGGIAMQEAGFRIYIRCERGEAQRLNDYIGRDQTWIALSGRTRFTIAHEIAHTFFIRSFYSQYMPGSKLNDPDSIRSLENTCDATAARMLMPEAIIRYEEREKDFLDPKDLRDFANRAGVSTKALVYRFAHRGPTPPPYGIVCSVIRTRQGPAIRALTRHPGFQGIFPELRIGTLVTNVLRDASFSMSGGQELQIVQKHEGRNYMIATEQKTLAPGWNTSFLTVRFDPSNIR